MRILIVIWSIQIGGGETFAIELCKHLKERGYEPFLFPVCSPWDENYYKHISSLNITILSPFKNKFFNWASWKINALCEKIGFMSFRNWVNVRFIKRAIATHKIKLAISNAIAADLFVFNNLKGRIRYIVVEHGDYSLTITDQKDICWDGLLHADEIICVSQWCKDMLIKKKVNSTILVIYNGHTATRLNNPQEIKTCLKSDVFSYCLIGRGIQLKGWEEAIKSFLIVKANYPSTRLILIGEGEFLNHLKKKYENVPDICFTGKLTRPLDVIKDIDVGLVPTQRSEAFGLAILDFFSQGKPVIATKIGGIPEVVNYGNKKGGVLVPVDENGKAIIKTLAEEMIAMMKNKEVYLSASNHATEIYHDFSFERTGEEYEKVIKKYL